MRQESLPEPVCMGASLVLASASPRRIAILNRAGFRFTVAPAERIDEAAIPDRGAPDATATGLAAAKAAEVSEAHPDAYVLGADTVVVLDGKLLGKPRDGDGAKEMLLRLRNRAHTVVTGVAVAGPGGVVAGARTTIVRLRDYSDAEIETYVGGGSPMDKAGAYGIQDREFAPADAFTGCYLNVVGLPLCLTLELLSRSGALLDGTKRPRCNRALAEDASGRPGQV